MDESFPVADHEILQVSKTTVLHNHQQISCSFRIVQTNQTSCWIRTTHSNNHSNSNDFSYTNPKVRNRTRAGWRFHIVLMRANELLDAGEPHNQLPLMTFF